MTPNSDTPVPASDDVRRQTTSVLSGVKWDASGLMPASLPGAHVVAIESAGRSLPPLVSLSEHAFRHAIAVDEQMFEHCAEMQDQ